LEFLIKNIRKKVIKDALNAGFPKDDLPLSEGGRGATAYGDAIALYLSFLLDQLTNQLSNICGWNNINQQMIITFARQAIPMMWGFAEANPFSNSSGSINNLHQRMINGFKNIPLGNPGKVVLTDTKKGIKAQNIIISTDPPYFDNIGYADLSEFFYVWQKRTIGNFFPNILKEITTPKTDEINAIRMRHGSKTKAIKYFSSSMIKALKGIAEASHEAFPITIYFAFKKTGSKTEGKHPQEWVTFLEALLHAGLIIVRTWPFKTESPNKLKSKVNTLETSLVIVCRKRNYEGLRISYNDFCNELKKTVIRELKILIGTKDGHLPIAPVDLAQAIIGPGMGTYSRYEAVLNPDGSSVRVGDALELIHKYFIGYLKPTKRDFDNETLFCVNWFESNGFGKGNIEDAKKLSETHNISLKMLRQSSVININKNLVYLVRWQDYPTTDFRTKTNLKKIKWSQWKELHQHIKITNSELGEMERSDYIHIRDKLTKLRKMVYFLYEVCDKNKNAKYAVYYNHLILLWNKF
jgi:putative DNA methylase